MTQKAKRTQRALPTRSPEQQRQVSAAVAWVVEQPTKAHWVPDPWGHGSETRGEIADRDEVQYVSDAIGAAYNEGALRGNRDLVILAQTLDGRRFTFGWTGAADGSSGEVFTVDGWPTGCGK